jgi:hypothetical protein
MVCEIDSFLIHCEDSSKWIGASKPIKPLHKISGTGCIYCCLENQIEKLQSELAEKESIIEQMVDVSIVTKLNEEIAEKDKVIDEVKKLIIELTTIQKINTKEKAKEWLEKYDKQKDEVKG